MAPQTIMTAVMMCSFGAAPCPLVVLPIGALVMIGPPATMIDFVPMMNIMSFGMCTSPANPAVIAALGAPQPCVPVTVAPWAPPIATTVMTIAPTTTMPAMTMCAWAGVVTQVFPGQVTTLTGP